MEGGRDDLATRLDRKFFESTRGKFVTLLRRSGCTVEDLARELGLTDNGVRAHLATLEREGALVIRGHSCPLVAVTPDHPEVCRMAETLIAELAGIPVYERCDRGESPH
jgi:predicted ArsR family transcriptional regulator